MKHPYEKLQRYELFTMIIAVVLAIVSLTQTAFSWIILFMFYTLSLSFMFEALIEWTKRNTLGFVYQIIRAVLLTVFSTLLFF
ncbi:hypothetical protein [Thalassobacillus hwangdonensis]|uniref:Uncharacterized protein n=1 Tax=Thalassobacillus hwangdonensis TaxID=546108 RepID=A0ABW3L5L5_9BACI